MDRRSLHKLTKHLAFAAKNQYPEEEKKPILERTIPKIPIPLSVRRKPLKLEPTIKLPEPKTPEKVPEKLETKEMDKESPSLEGLTQALVKPVTPDQPKTPNFGKITPFIADTSVRIIECPGPNKEVKVKKSGTVQPTGISLTSEEITEIIDQFATKENAPLTQLFKAKLNGISITAFISPVSGTKFMILRD